MKINKDFIIEFLIKYQETGKLGVNKIYAELFWDDNKESQFLYQHIKYMIDSGLLEGDNSAFWGITPKGYEYIEKPYTTSSQPSNITIYQTNNYSNKFNSIPNIRESEPANLKEKVMDTFKFLGKTALDVGLSKLIDKFFNLS